ncbi:hypothetical protein [Bacteroides fragilis]|uniref:hypothetical protein n=1 Tax=Bacteroides fragilis TaxID=817 RepID=UPI001C700C2D|nr:hypothetical protein [Bacteroides fragilis]MBW9278953.1 hypothetical protein [Bacteroides fragilis]
MKRISSICIIVLLILLCISEFSLFQKNNHLRKLVSTKENQIGSLAMDKDLLLNNMQMQYANNGYQLNDFLLTNITGSTLKLSNLLDDHYKIIFRFSYLHCSSCVEFELKNIIEIAERIPKDRIIIIAEYDNKRGFSAFTKAHNITLPIYFLSENTHADNILQDENIPYVCLMDKKMKIEHLFIPIKEVPIYSERYYHHIIQRYF